MCVYWHARIRKIHAYNTGMLSLDISELHCIPTWICEVIKTRNMIAFIHQHARFNNMQVLLWQTCKHKHGLFCQDARWSIFVTQLEQLFIMFTITNLKHPGFRMLTVNSFISFAVFWVHFINILLISSSVTNNSVFMCPVEYCLESVEKYSEAQVY